MPDLLLRLLPECGGQSRYNEHQYLVGAPELIDEPELVDPPGPFYRILQIDPDPADKRRRIVRIEWLLKTARGAARPVRDSFTFALNEGGGDRAPCGLALLSAGLAFCYMTQIARYVETMKLAVGSVRLVQFSPFLTGGAEGFDTHLFLNGEAPDEVQGNLLTIAARTCYLHATMAAALPPLVSAKHNGSPLPR